MSNRSHRNSVSSRKRKPLGTLVPSAVHQNILIGSHGVVRLQEKSKKQKLGSENSVLSKTDSCQLEILETNEYNKKVSKVDVSTQCNASKSDEVTKWMTSVDKPEGYWKEMSEQRRIALEESLKENEKLHEKIESMELQFEILEKENEVLRKMADEAEELKNLLKDI